MALTALTRPTVSHGPAPALTHRAAPPDLSGLASLEANSHRTDVQALIGDAIRRGTVRVLPVPDSPDRVRVVRVTPGERTGPSHDRG